MIDYVFKDADLLNEALTHPSAVSEGERAGQGSRALPDDAQRAAGERSLRCNQRMEFLGDSILGAVVAQYLYENLPNRPEGDLTKLRANLVCEDALCGYANKIALGEMLIMGRGAALSGGRELKSVLADAFEAVIAAIYLDSGLGAAREFILPFLPDKAKLESSKHVSGDYKSALQEIVQQNPNASLYYDEIGESGAAHNKRFFASVVVNGTVRGEGSGKTKKESQQMAAKAALTEMGYET